MKNQPLFNPTYPPMQTHGVTPLVVKIKQGYSQAIYVGAGIQIAPIPPGIQVTIQTNQHPVIDVVPYDPSGKNLIVIETMEGRTIEVIKADRAAMQRVGQTPPHARPTGSWAEQLADIGQTQYPYPEVQWGYHSPTNAPWPRNDYSQLTNNRMNSVHDIYRLGEFQPAGRSGAIVVNSSAMARLEEIIKLGIPLTDIEEYLAAVIRELKQYNETVNTRAFKPTPLQTSSWPICIEWDEQLESKATTVLDHYGRVVCLHANKSDLPGEDIGGLTVGTSFVPMSFHAGVYHTTIDGHQKHSSAIHECMHRDSVTRFEQTITGVQELMYAVRNKMLETEDQHD